MTPSERLALIRAVLLECRAATGAAGRPIAIDGCPTTDLNQCVAALVEEELIHARPLGHAFANGWVADGITYRGLEYLEAWDVGSRAERILREKSRSRARSETFLEIVNTLAKSIQIGGV